MGAVDKRRRSTGSLTVARNFLILASCFLLGLFSVRFLRGKVLSKTSFIRLSAEDPLQRCPPQSLTASSCNCTTNSTAGGPPALLTSNPRTLALNSDGKADTSLPEKSLQPLAEVLLFVGILSGRGYRHRRLAVRESWANACQVSEVSVCRFILSEDEETPQVHREVEQFGDVVFVKEKTNYKSILYKTYYVLEYAIKGFDVRYILKTDDDAFINVPALVHQLRQLCQSEDCRSERLYMGRMAKESEVLLQPGHKWNNIVFHNHTGLKTYPTYAMGGGYVLSGDVAKVLVNINNNMRLKFTPIEDATIGFWLMAMDLRHIDHTRFWTWASPCCFKSPVRKEGQRIVTRFQLEDAIQADLCSLDPWLVLHKIDSPTKMRFIGQKLAECNNSYLEPDFVAPSIAPFISSYQPSHALE